MLFPISICDLRKKNESQDRIMFYERFTLFWVIDVMTRKWIWGLRMRSKGCAEISMLRFRAFKNERLFATKCLGGRLRSISMDGSKSNKSRNCVPVVPRTRKEL